MVCKNCHNENIDGVKFCFFCGSELSDLAEKQTINDTANNNSKKNTEDTSTVDANDSKQNHNLNSKKSVSQVNADLAMIPTYEDMIKGRQITDRTWQMLPKNIKKGTSVNDLSDSIDTNSRPNSLIINLKATTQNNEKSVAFVNYTADAVKKELPKMQQGIGTVHVYEKASKKNVTTQVHSSVKKYTLVGIALGIVAGMVVSFVATSWKHIA